MRPLWIASSLAAVLTAGCAGTYGYSTYDTYGYADLYGDVYTDIAPPEPLVEVVPPRPRPDYAWINGYWAWSGNRYLWRPGRWVARPAGQVWLRHGWVLDDGRYRYVPGRWLPPSRYRQVPYTHAYPPVRYGDRYAVIPYGQRRYPYAYVPRDYYHPRYYDQYAWRYQGRPWSYRRVPPARAYVIP